MTDTWAERILAALRAAGTPLDDDRLAFRLDASQRQTINQACRRLQSAGMLKREPGPDGKIVNVLTASDPDSAAARSPMTPGHAVRTVRPPSPLTEDEVKAAVKAHLEEAGWSVTVAWGRDRGVDIEAHRSGARMFLEAKGEATNPPQQVNYFLGALGELVQRLRDPDATYGLALPDNAQYQGLVKRLPTLAWERLNLAILLVDPRDRRSVRSADSS